MNLGLIRVAFLSSTLPAALGGLAVFWLQPSAFPTTHASRYALSLGPLAIGVLGLVATFAAFDRPRSACRWAACLAGLAGGAALAGLLLFPPTFLFVGAPLLAYAAAVLALGRALTRRAAEEAGDQPPCRARRAGAPAPAVRAEDRGVRPLTVAFALAGPPWRGVGVRRRRGPARRRRPTPPRRRWRGAPPTRTPPSTAGSSLARTRWS